MAVGRIVEAEPAAAAETAELVVAAEENVGSAEPEKVAAIREIATAHARVVSTAEPEPRWAEEPMPEGKRLRASRSVARLTTRRAKPI